MSLQCYLYEYKTLNIKDTCRHLRNVHILSESSNLILKCCIDTDCPAIFRTYCGFTKHLKKCILKKENAPSTSNDCEGAQNFEEFDINSDSNSINDLDVTSNKSYTEKNQLTESDTERRQLIEETISNYVIHLYSLGLPDLVITRILETTSNLIFPLIDDMLSISNLDERQNLAHNLRYTFENHVTEYKRNKNLPSNFVQPIRKLMVLELKKNTIVKHCPINKFR